MMKAVATLALLLMALIPAAGGTDAKGEECAMPAWAHGEWRLLHADVSCSAGHRSKSQAMPEQIDGERHQLLPRNATALGLVV